MKIEVGKRYVRRNWTTTPPLIEDFVPGTGFALDPETGFVFGEDFNGKPNQVFSYRLHDCDLMSEYVE
jgi:hypothetical protein